MPNVRITYRVADAPPPIFIAGSFTSPPWHALELQYATLGNGVVEYFADFRINEGKYHYKFRYGIEGPWNCDENVETERDAAGHRNNVLDVTLDQVLHDDIPVHEEMYGEARTQEELINKYSLREDTEPIEPVPEAPDYENTAPEDPAPVGLVEDVTAEDQPPADANQVRSRLDIITELEHECWNAREQDDRARYLRNVSRNSRLVNCVGSVIRAHDTVWKKHPNTTMSGIRVLRVTDEVVIIHYQLEWTLRTFRRKQRRSSTWRKRRDGETWEQIFHTCVDIPRDEPNVYRAWGENANE